MYGATSDAAMLDWGSTRDRIVAAGTYWVVARSAGLPHPRPVWGVWVDERLHLSIGSPVVTRQLDADPRVTVHLDSGTDVVVVEGTVTGASAAAALVGAYDAKYEWRYDAEEYGPLTEVTPHAVLAWRAGGWAGRDGFEATARWRFAST
jgi:hypothetical protein